MQANQSAVLVLADGAIFPGIGVGATGHICGEVVFHTAQTGYQEILTDPSYAGQLIVFTQPHIGNVGVNAADMESNRIQVKGVMMRCLSSVASNWRSQQTLAAFLQKQNVFVISDVDTRALTQHLQQTGSQPGCLMVGDVDIAKALCAAQYFEGLLGSDLIQQVTTNKIYTCHQGESPSAYHVVVYDFGVKQSILQALAKRGCKVTVVPATTTAEQVLALAPQGVLLSNGPGDPAACDAAIQATKKLLQQAMPIMAICLGHQLLALASGATTEKMHVGHHGANHPVQCLKTGRVAISSQNHGFVVAEKNFPSNLTVTHRSLFDGTIAGIARNDVPAFGFQGHPEASPGPSDLTILFDDFMTMLEVTHAKAS